jgi:alpha 1,3-glucosidase
MSVPLTLAALCRFELDNPMALYGSIPFMLAHTTKMTTGLFFLNSAEMWIDVERTGTDGGVLSSLVGGGATDTATHWMAESGIIDVFVLLGPAPKDVFRQCVDLIRHHVPRPLCFMCRLDHVFIVLDHG